MSRTSQYCIKSTKFDDVLKQIPGAFEINELAWEVWSPGNMQSLHIPEYWKIVGVQKIRQSQPRMNARGVFKLMPKDKVESLVEKFCNKNRLFLRADIKVNRLTVSNGKNKLVFKKIKKKIDGEKKAKQYLGLSSTLFGSETLLAKMNAKKVYCNSHVETKTFFTCSEKPL